PLPAGASLSISLGPDTPSAEGSRRTTDAQTFNGRTYAPLKVTDVSCDWGSECPPGSTLYVQFNNVLDADKSDAGKVSVSPALTAMTASVQSSTLVIGGATSARTEYTITIPGSFTDMYGQTLGKDTPVKVRIGSAPPSIQQLDAITTLDPLADAQQLSLWSVSHQQLRVRVFAVQPSDFAAYYSYLNRRDYEDTKLPSWPVLADTKVSVEGDRDNPIVTDIDLSGALAGKPGQVVVLVEPVPAVSVNSPDYWQNRPALTWAQSTTLGVDALADASNLHVWATDLRTGAPRAGVSLSMIASGSTPTATTDGDGLGRLALPSSGNDDGLVALVATEGDEAAILTTWATRSSVTDQLRWYVFDDRQVYQPGETMKVKGWLRRIAFTTDASLHGVESGSKVEYTVTDSYGNTVLQGSTKVGGLGGFDLSLDIPETADLGYATLQLRATGAGGVVDDSYYHQFQIQQYRRPEFEVTTRPESEGPYVSTKPATVAATGTYYAGGPLVNADVDWVVSTSATTYAPPGWDGFAFGVWIPWWYSYGGGIEGDYARNSMPCCGPVGDTTTATYHGTTDASGTHYLQLGFEEQDGSLPDLPVSVSAQATVTDVNRQAWASTTGLLVHATDRYVGLRSSRSFVRQGDPLDVDAVVTGIDGQALPGVTVDVVAGRVEWKYVNGEYTETVVDQQTCTVTSAAEPVHCAFDTAVGGQYKVTAVVTGTDGGHNRTELTVWVSGAQSVPTRGVQQQVLTVVPDKDTYAIGDTAELLVQAPFATGEGLMTVVHNGVRRSERFNIADGSAVLTVPITEDDIPSLSLQFEVVGATERTADDGSAVTDAPLRPAYAVGSLTLPVPAVSRTLSVTATPRDTELTPGESTTIDVVVKDANGAPVKGAEFAVVVVDEAVLALSGYSLPDPLGVFYGGGYDSLSGYYSREQIQLLDPARLAAQAAGRDTEDTAAAGGAEGDGYSGATATTTVPSAMPAADESVAGGQKNALAGTPIEVRSNFDALALFQPDVSTGADGRAEVPLTLPDNLTRYRVMVVAVSGEDRFGSAESNLTARLPLAVRPSAPRFANFGDEFQLPVVVQNNTDAPLTVDVVLQTDNLLPADASGQTVSVPANDRVEVQFAVSTESAGDARFRATAVSGDLADSATVSLPVYTPATSEA
ncbi:MAG TPA: alpha-2-macroglobulin family protein, partial [Ilumatobacteraceae bacterium]|nr:alpha-2-macroglobulin family protein [Ilumatobacteraceae bacterium]